MGWYNHAYCIGEFSPDSRKQSVKQLPFAIVYWARFPSQLKNPTNQPKKPTKKPKPKTRIFWGQDLRSPFYDLPYYVIQLLHLIASLLSHPGHLVPVNLHCQESLAWGSIGHLGVKLWERPTCCKWRLYLIQPMLFPNHWRATPRIQRRLQNKKQLTPSLWQYWDGRQGDEREDQ